MTNGTTEERKVALVTGGSRGIGLGIAEALVGRGFDVVLTGLRSEQQVGASLDGLRAVGASVLYLRADVAEIADHARLLNAIDARFGRLDVLVNNAGMAPKIRADILEATEAGFDEVLATNLKGPYFLTQAVARWMIRQQEVAREARAIVNVGSVSATVASIQRGDYCLSKAGIAMATRLWAARLTQHGIGVYEVRPGIIATDMTAAVKEKYDTLIADNLLLEPRWGTPADVGRAVAMLASGDLAYAPGAVLMIDGGLTLPRL